MKKLISIIVLLAMLVCAIIMAIPALAEETETEKEPFADPDIQYFEFPHPFLKGTTDGAHMDKDEYLELLKEKLPAIGEIDVEFYDEYPSFLWEYMTSFDREKLENSYTGFPVPDYPKFYTPDNPSESRDRSYIVSCKDGYFVILYTTPRNYEPDPTPITDPRSTHEWADYFWRYIYGPFSSDEKADEYYALEEEMEIRIYDELPEDLIPLIAKYINGMRDHAIETGNADPDTIISGEEFAERLGASLEEGYYIEFSTGRNQENSDYQDYCFITRTYEGKIKVITFTADRSAYPGMGIIEPGINPPVQTETEPVEPAPDETEKLPGTGTTEPVAAPKTVDRLALIIAGLVLSLTACAAVSTVVKEKSR